MLFNTCYSIRYRISLIFSSHLISPPVFSLQVQPKLNISSLPPEIPTSSYKHKMSPDSTIHNSPFLYSHAATSKKTINIHPKITASTTTSIFTCRDASLPPLTFVLGFELGLEILGFFHFAGGGGCKCRNDPCLGLEWSRKLAKKRFE